MKEAGDKHERPINVKKQKEVMDLYMDNFKSKIVAQSQNGLSDMLISEHVSMDTIEKRKNKCE